MRAVPVLLLAMAVPAAAQRAMPDAIPDDAGALAACIAGQADDAVKACLDRPTGATASRAGSGGAK